MPRQYVTQVLDKSGIKGRNKSVKLPHDTPIAQGEFMIRRSKKECERISQKA
jgi:hypothetical protein